MNTNVMVPQNDLLAIGLVSTTLIVLLIIEYVSIYVLLLPILVLILFRSKKIV